MLVRDEAKPFSRNLITIFTVFEMKKLITTHVTVI